MEDLKQQIKDKGLKQVWIAEKMGVGKALVSQWVSGTTPVAEKHIVKLRALIYGDQAPAANKG